MCDVICVTKCQNTSHNDIADFLINKYYVSPDPALGGWLPRLFFDFCPQLCALFGKYVLALDSTIIILALPLKIFPANLPHNFVHLNKHTKV